MYFDDTLRAPQYAIGTQEFQATDSKRIQPDWSQSEIYNLKSEMSDHLPVLSTSAAYSSGVSMFAATNGSFTVKYWTCS